MTVSKDQTSSVPKMNIEASSQADQPRLKKLASLQLAQSDRGSISPYQPTAKPLPENRPIVAGGSANPLARSIVRVEGNRPITASDLDVRESDSLPANRPISRAQSSQTNPDLMGYLD